MSWGHSRPEPGDTDLNSHILDEAARAVMKAVRVDRTRDVPYVGSCNRRGDTIYIDWELPIHLCSKGKNFDVDRYVVMHEVVEMLFEHALAFEYRDAHQIALRVERALVESDGLSWAVYCRFCTKWCRRIGRRKVYANPPRDIDLQPEYDSEDEATLKRLSRGTPRSRSRPAPHARPLAARRYKSR